MSKTPYELRTDLLSMAIGIASEKHYQENQRRTSDWEKECETLNYLMHTENVTANFPKAPVSTSATAEEIIEVANKLNDFVTNG